MLQNGVLETSWSYFLAWRQKCFKTASWRPPGAIFELGARNASKRPPGDLLKLLFGLAREMLQNGLLEISLAGPRNPSTRPPGDLVKAWGQKFFKTASWRPPGPTFEPGARNASKRLPGSLLDPLLGLGLEMLAKQPPGRLLEPRDSFLDRGRVFSVRRCAQRRAQRQFPGQGSCFQRAQRCAVTCAEAVSSTGVVFSACAEVRSDVRRCSFLDRGRVFVKQ